MVRIRFSLMFVDQRMPEMDGLEMLKMLQRSIPGGCRPRS